jgi:hypothetical protein
LRFKSRMRRERLEYAGRYCQRYHIWCSTMGWASPDLSAIKKNSMNDNFFHFAYFPFAAMLQCCNTAILQYCNTAILQYCNASVQSVDLLSENHFQSVNGDFLQNFSDFRKKFICRPELLSLDWRRLLRYSNKKIRKQEQVRGSWVRRVW